MTPSRPRLILAALLSLAACDQADGPSEIEHEVLTFADGAEEDGAVPERADTDTELPRRAAPEAPGVSPKTGYWRWEAMGEFVDGCGVSEQPVDYGLALIIAGQDQIHLATHGGEQRVCTLANGDFGCDDAGSTLLPNPAVAFEAIDGAFTSETKGSMAYRLAGECDGSECEAIAAERGVEFPCESAALTQLRYLPPIELADEGCEAEAGLSRGASSTQAVIQLHNTGNDELQAYRIDAEGNRVLEAEVGPGQHPRVLWTFVGENWVVTDSQGECVSVHRATEDAGIVTVY